MTNKTTDQRELLDIVLECSGSILWDQTIYRLKMAELFVKAARLLLDDVTCDLESGLYRASRPLLAAARCLNHQSNSDPYGCAHPIYKDMQAIAGTILMTSPYGLLNRLKSASPATYDCTLGEYVLSNYDRGLRGTILNVVLAVAHAAASYDTASIRTSIQTGRRFDSGSNFLQHDLESYISELCSKKDKNDVYWWYERFSRDDLVENKIRQRVEAQYNKLRNPTAVP